MTMLAWQYWFMSALSGGAGTRAEQVAAELVRCRQRGLDRLDRIDHRQRPVPAPELEALASGYVSRQNITVTGRVAQIKILLSAALDAFSASGSDDARLVRGLLFGEPARLAGGGRRDAPDQVPVLVVQKSPGQLLRDARRSFGEPSETLFRERFKTAFRTFAEFLLQHADPRGAATETADSGRPAEVAAQQLRVTVTELEDGRPQRFIELLADATEATVVGFDNELLADALGAALELKRARQGDPRAFWRSLDVVFLGPALLDYLDDHAVSPDRRVVVRERRRTMTDASQSVALLLRKSGATEWTISYTPLLPAFAGSLFVLPGQRHVVQLIVRQPAPRTRMADRLYLEFDDTPSEYFTKAFRRIVDRSITDNRPVPVGNTFGGTFVCTETVYRAEVLRRGSGGQGWLPMVVVITTQRRRGQVAPLLQLRTEKNAVRELGLLSHLSRHIYQEEPSPFPAAQPISAPPSFDINSECARFAAQLRVQTETGDDMLPDIKELGTGRYVNPDTDNLFFFVYSLDLPEETKLPPRSDIYSFTLGELLDIRAYQALRIASALCKIDERPGRFWQTAVELATLNLTLHKRGELASRMVRLADGPAAGLARVAAEIDEALAAAVPTCESAGRELRITGLAGWQYREFYTVLVPQYAKVGVPGAAEELSRISSDQERSIISRVASLYRDEDLLRSVPIEL
jgi:hypothetical protein